MSKSKYDAKYEDISSASSDSDSATSEESESFSSGKSKHKYIPILTQCFLSNLSMRLIVLDA